MPKISAYPRTSPILAGDEFVIARAGFNAKVLGSEFLHRQGELINGKISVTVAGNNLTVALKTLAGGNPALADPVFINFGGSRYAITAALSVTKNAGTNWCNAGSAELATKEIDYFAYLGFNSIDGITIGFSRIPYATAYVDFSTTSTNERYAGISTITNATSGDEYAVIGRFAATLSAGAGYTWSVPAYTAQNLIQRPIFHTRLLSWTPTITYAGGTTSPTSNVVSIARYQMVNYQMLFQVQSLLTRGAGNRTSTTYTLPWSTPSITPFNAADQITATAIKMPTAAYTNTNTAIIVETMANDGFYFLKGVFPMI